MKKILMIIALLFVFFVANTADAITLDCMFCHSLPVGSGGKYPPINTSLFGSHMDINSSDGTGNLTSSDCISCHYSASTSFFHSFPVSTYTCEDCHINGTNPGAPRVNNHIKNSNISVNALCSDCHNKTATIFLYGKNASAAHYGINASFGQSPGYDYCAFCHSNSTTIYKDVMQNQSNYQIKNHTSVINFSAHGQPDCSTCHGTDINLHGSNISKPILNSDFCLNCHINDTLKKTRHNDKVECSSCHTQTQSDIHNIKYVMQDGSYSSINATACTDCHNFSLSSPYLQLTLSVADCTTCHQNGGLPRFNFAPQLPTPLKHSTNPNSGSMWNAAQVAYWNNTSLKSACKYCHGNTLHSSNATGNIKNIQSGNNVNQSITNTGYWCANCHYMNTSFGNYYYNASSYSPVPPEIQNKTGLVPQTSSDGTNFFNHSLDNWSDNVCKPCHSTNSPNYSTQFIHNVNSGGGGRDCGSCHDTLGNGAPLNKRLDISDFSKSVHKNINGGGNRACWACHGDGDGSQSAQPAGGHPLNYRTPKNCNNSDCHSISQSNFKEPMIYSHFQNASKNNNPNNITNYNIAVSVQCQICHINSLEKEDSSTGLALVSHYGSKDNLVDSFNCIYCHLDKDNSEDWGDATLIQKNRTGLVKLDREQNKFTVYEGESVYLGEGYFLKLVEVSTVRDVALIQLSKNDIMVDQVSLAIGTSYEYEHEVTIDNTTLKIPDITINITSMFKGSRGLIQFEGYRSRKIHTDKESKNSACFACHQYRYFGEKERYVILDKENQESYDDIYYTRVFVDMRSESKSKIYIDNDDYIFDQLGNYSGKYSPYPYKKKYLKEGETWEISDNYSLKLNEVSTDSEVALLTLTINGMIVESGPISKGHEIKYTPAIEYKPYTQTNVTVFTANVTSIFQAKTNFILLEDVVAISPDVMKITSNLTLFGYNSSWFKINDTFASGLIPPDLHSPNQYDNVRNWADCMRCHDSSKDLRIENFDATSSNLGKHSGLNHNASNRTFISNPIDKACWACHTGGTEPQMHMPTNILPRECGSCHTSQKEPFYGAIYLGDEIHGNLSDCGSCHITDTHILKRFQVTPVVMRVVLPNNEVRKGESIKIMAKAVAGYGMRIRAVEYFIDETGTNGNGTPLYPTDGTYNSQTEDTQAQFYSTNISTGAHVLYIHAMERNNRWGEFYQANFSVIPDGVSASEKSIPNLSEPGMIYGLISIILSYLIILCRGRK